MDNINPLRLKLYLTTMKSKILIIIQNMSTNICEYIVNTPITKTKVKIDCSLCSKHYAITAEAIYKQHKRGNNKYICKSCSSKKAWTHEKRTKAQKQSKKRWLDPHYKGTIVGKAIINNIKNTTDLDDIFKNQQD